jgi:hypothetical protein
MSSQDDISRAADQFKDALNAAAVVMTVRDRPVSLPTVRSGVRAGGCCR